jgi:hypothetical protein
MNLTDQIAERYVPDVFELDPVWATLAGISGYDDRMADLSPASHALALGSLGLDPLREALSRL